MNPSEFFSANTYYREAKEGRGPIFIGHRTGKGNRRQNLEFFLNDVCTHKEKSKFFANVFCPERTSTSYTYEINKAYMAGAIDARRPFVLVSPIEHYKNPSYTIDEILWLLDNGYTLEPFRLEPGSPLCYIGLSPPEVFTQPPFMRNYDCARGTDNVYGQPIISAEKKMNAYINRLGEIKDEIFNKSASLNSVSSNSTGYENSNDRWQTFKSEIMDKLRTLNTEEKLSWRSETIIRGKNVNETNAKLNNFGLFSKVQSILKIENNNLLNTQKELVSESPKNFNCLSQK